MNIADVAEALKRKRKAQGLSLRAVAAEVGIPTMTVHRIERGQEVYGSKLLTVAAWASADALVRAPIQIVLRP